MLKFKMICILLFVISCGNQGSSFKGNANGVRKIEAEPEETAPEQDSSDQKVESPEIPEAAVTKGSFSAYSIPASPRKGQNYQIIVVVSFGTNLPGPNYNANDLLGQLQGTDGYTYRLGEGVGYFNSKKIYPEDIGISRMESFVYDPQNSRAIYRIGVPGAHTPLTRDTVSITSDYLQESQTLEILFR